MSCGYCLNEFNNGCTTCSYCGTTMAEFAEVTTLADESMFVLANDKKVSLATLRNILNFSVESDISMFPDGTILQVFDGQLLASALLENSDEIISSKDIEVPENSLRLGKSISIHNQGGQLGITAGGKEYYLSQFLVDGTGSGRPLWYNYGAETLENIQLTDSTSIDAISIQFLMSFGVAGDSWRFNTFRLRANKVTAGARIVISQDGVPNVDQTNIVWKSHEDAAWNDGDGYSLVIGNNDLDTRGLSLEVDSVYYMTIEVPVSAGTTIGLDADGSSVPFQQAFAQTGEVETTVTSDELTGFGDVFGAPSSTANNMVLFADATGKLIADSGIAILTAGAGALYLDDQGNYTTPADATIWGNVTGTLSDQLDLQAALDLKGDITGQAFVTGTYNGVNLTTVGLSTDYLAASGVYLPLPAGAVDSVFGRAGIVVAQNGDYTTTQVTEGTNLYYTDVRVSANASVTANTAKVTNVTTDLSVGTTTATTLDVNSSDGTNATLPAAIATTAAGLQTGADKAKLDGIEAGAQVNVDMQGVYDIGADSVIDVDNTIGAFTLNNTGKTVAAFNVVPNATTPTTSLAAGDVHIGSDSTMYIYDGVRSKFLSTALINLQAGKNNEADNEYLRIGGDARDGDAGFIFPWDVTIVGLSLQGSNSVVQDFDIEIDGVPNTTLATVGSVINNDALDIDVDAGETINLFAQASGNGVDDLYVIIFVKRRLN